MQAAERIRHARHSSTVFGLVFVAAGVICSIGAITMSRRIVLEEKEKALIDYAASIDKNIANTASNIHDQLYYITADDEFKEAEQEFFSGGNSFPLWRILRNNSLCDSELISAMIGMTRGKVQIASDNDFYGDIFFYDDLGNYGLSFCRLQNGRYYLAFKFNGYLDGMQYYALMDSEVLYDQVVVSPVEKGTDNVVLYSDELDFLITRGEDSTIVRHVSDLEYIEERGIATIIKELESYSMNEPGTDIVDRSSGSGVAEFVTIYPASISDNGVFSVAFISDYDSVLGDMMHMNMLIIIGIGIFFLGVFSLMNGLVEAESVHERQTTEIEELKDKNILMQGQMDEMRELEHSQRLELLGSMTSGISHEFNNLLTPIMAYSLMSLEIVPKDNTELSDNIIEIYNASKKAKDIVKRISELSKKTAPDTMTYIEVDSFMDKMLSLTRVSKPDNVSIIREYDAKGYCIYANETQISQVFMNIIINAFSLMDKEGDILRIRTGHFSSKYEVVITISDTGPGIPKENLEHIFEPFFTTREQGTGLGLAIAKNIIDTLGGSISVRSHFGSSTTFIVALPAFKQEGEDQEDTDKEKDQEALPED